ncbi:MAG: hypothetical protein WCH34_08795 [Bacteroidota bacterium]
MSSPVGTHMGKNPLKLAMESSIPNAAEISEVVATNVFNKKGTDTRINDLNTYYAPKNAAFQVEVAKQIADKLFQQSATKQIVTTVKGTKLELKSWKKQIVAVYDEGTEEYDRLLIGGLSSFYQGSRKARLMRINALITAIGDDASLATLKAQIQLFADAFTAKKGNQAEDKQAVKDDTSDINTLRNTCIKGLWYVYCGLIMVFIDNPSKALAFFPMELIYKATREKKYTMLVPAHIIKKICIHLFKAGEMVTMTNNGSVELKVGLALKANSNVLVWYTLAAGQTVKVNPISLGNVAYKYVMVKNEDLETRGDITFIISPA